MVVVRRVYVLLVSAISLQAVVWAIIVLLRNLLLSELNAPPSTIALQTAVIVVGLPIFLVHWLWAQRLAGDDEEERVAALRRFYLVGIMAAFVAPFAANSFSLLQILLRQLLGVQRPFLNHPTDSLAASFIYYGAALLTLALFWLYQRHVFQQDRRRQQSGETALQALAPRSYIFAFAAAGLTMASTALVLLLRWLLYQLGDVAAAVATTSSLANELTRLLVGLGLWLIFWLRAQRLFSDGPEMERESALRKLYLYTAVFLGTVTVVASATAILAGILSRLLRAPTIGNVREPLAALIVMGVVWAYHAAVLYSDSRQSAELPQQASIRRLYRYLVAGVGLLALLIGLGGVVSIFFFVLDGDPFIGNLRQALAWFIAAIMAGGLVWLLPWRQIQVEAAGENGAGQAARHALVRKIYLYLFVFMATMVVLGTVIYIVSQLVELLLGSRSTASLLRDLGLALAYSLLAVGLWLYHGTILRSDNRAAVQAERAGLSTMRVAILSGDQPALMERLRQGLQQKLPELQLHPAQPAGSLPGESVPDTIPDTAVLAEADLIISPATLALYNGQAELAAAVASSSAYKLFVPVSQQDCLWLGVENLDETAVIKQAEEVIQKMAAGKSVSLTRSLGIGTIVALIVGGCILLSFLSLLIDLLATNLF
jgi:hypothetical protein